ncbi:class I SAM-dependent methyltransferase [Candidatus Obscuribacterales bacterium]|nr:class I SAM-dependent methyltransferase [Candidatus Obscuribacterales bacterium]
MSATLSIDYIQGWRRWSDLHHPANFEITIVEQFLDLKRNENTDIKPLAAMNILEIGCGDGRVMREFAPVAKSVVGIDTNSQVIEFLQSEIEQAFMAIISSNLDAANINVAVEKMSGTDLQFEDESFDLVLFPWSLHQIEDKQTALKEAKRVLAPNGHLVVFGLLPGGEYENAVAELGLDPGPQVDPVEAYEKPLIEAFGKIDDSLTISSKPEDKEFGFLFPDIETAISDWKWALQNWHEQSVQQEQLKTMSARMERNVRKDGVFMNISGRAYLCSK